MIIALLKTLLVFLFGNYTSQFFANIYLNELDQYLKRTLKVKYYVRYMDDFILLADTKSDVVSLKHAIEIFLHSHLELSLNNKSRYYPSKMGVDFCGYRSFPTHRLLRTKNKRKIKNKVKLWNNLYSKNKLNIFKSMQSLNSWLGHSSHCNSYRLQQKIINNCNFILTDNTYTKIEQNLICDIIKNQYTK